MSDSVPRVRSAALIVNARSRRGQAQFREARRLAEGLDFPIDCHEVRDPARLDAVVQEALAKDPDLVILGGGDGTISGLVDHLVGRGVALGVLPLGTANSFARSLGIPLDLEGAIGVIAAGHYRRIDLGMIGDDYFANSAVMGLGPQISGTIPDRLKAIGGRFAYGAWAAWKFLRFRPFRVSLGSAAELQEIEAVELRIFNGRYHTGVEMIDEVEVDSGVIVVQVVTGSLRSRLLLNWGASLLGMKGHEGTARRFQGKAIRIVTDPSLPVSIDGEVLARTPVTARIAAGIIDVAAPPEEDGAP